MFKWFTDLFFDVEEEVIEEHHEKPQPPKKTTVVKQADKDAVAPIKPPVVDQLPKEERKSIFIDDVVPRRDDVPVLKKEAVIDHPVDKEYEFTPIISPMFGIDEKYQPRKVKKIEGEPFKPSRSALGTVLSPIYGSQIEDERPINIKDRQAEESIVNISIGDMLKHDRQPDAEDILPAAAPEAMDETEKADPEEPTLDSDSGEEAVAEVSEEEQFTADNQPSLFDYLDDKR